MSTIGENIAALRKKKGMTQEALATELGVSAQSISKWENNTNMPDIQLIPLIADTFDVTIDELYGRFHYEQRITPDQAFERCREAIVDIIGESSFHVNDGIHSLEEYMKYFREVVKGNWSRAKILRDNGLVYYRDDFGGILMRKPSEHWDDLLNNDEIFEILDFLADEDCRKVLLGMLKSKKYSFTIAGVCNKYGITDADKLEEKLKKSKHFYTKAILDGDGEILIYEYSAHAKQYFLYIILWVLDEYANFEPVYSMYDGFDDYLDK